MAQYFDDFQGYTLGGSMESQGWTRIIDSGHGATFEVHDTVTDAANPTGGRALRVNGVAGGYAGITPTVLASAGDQRVYGKVYFAPANAGRNGGLFVRGSDSINYYWCDWRSAVDLFKLKREVADSSGTIGTVPLVSPVNPYHVLLEVVGTTLRTKLWQGDPVTDEPASWTISGTNSSLTAGRAGPFAREVGSEKVWWTALGIGTGTDPAPRSAPVTTYTLTTSVVGSGTVVLGPAGGTYDDGTVVEVTAVPASGHQFAGWAGDLTGSGNPQNVTVDADKSVEATFEAIPAELELGRFFLRGGVWVPIEERLILREGAWV